MRPRRGQVVGWLIAAAIVLGIGVGGVLLFLFWLRPLVVVTEVVEAPVVQAFYATGTIQPRKEFPIRSNTAGTLSEVKVDKGDHLKQGDVLAVVTNSELIFLAEKAQAELEEKLKRADEKSPVLGEYDAKLLATEDLMAIAQREQKRVTDLMERNAGSQTDLDQAMDRLKQLWSQAESLKAQKAAKRFELEKDVQVARAAANIANWNLDQQTLRSPVDGVVLDRPVTLGTRVAVNDHLMRVADVRPENLVMRAAVDEEDKTKVLEGQAVRMTLYSFPGGAFAGKVSRIFDQAEPDRRTFEVEVEFDRVIDKLAAGMTGELAFVMASRDKAVVVPAQAVQDGSVMRVKDKRLELVPVTVGLRGVERAEVTQGLAVGDRVVISARGGMVGGQAVRTDYMDPAAAAGLNKPKEVDSSFKGFQ